MVLFIYKSTNYCLLISKFFSEIPGGRKESD